MRHVVFGGLFGTIKFSNIILKIHDFLGNRKDLCFDFLPNFCMTHFC